MKSDFFKTIDFDKLFDRKITPPFKPEVKDIEVLPLILLLFILLFLLLIILIYTNTYNKDTTYVDPNLVHEEMSEAVGGGKKLTKKDGHFGGFNFEGEGQG